MQVLDLLNLMRANNDTAADIIIIALIIIWYSKSINPFPLRHGEGKVLLCGSRGGVQCFLCDSFCVCYRCIFRSIDHFRIIKLKQDVPGLCFLFLFFFGWGVFSSACSNIAFVFCFFVFNKIK